MARVLVTGAGGFLGRVLVEQLQAALAPGDMLTLLDLNVASIHPQTRALSGDLSDPAVLDRALDDQPDVVYHLASVPGALAERNPELGDRVNLTASLNLIDRLARQDNRPRVVYASSVAVYGPLNPNQPVTDETPCAPTLRYGQHKVQVEASLEAATRAGTLSGVSLRLPGLVARPGKSSGHGSAFMSDLLRAVQSGTSYTCPVGLDASAWWMSASCAAWNLRRAVASDEPGTFLLPALHLSVGEVVDALCRAYGEERRARLSVQPDAWTTETFGRYPALETPTADRLGYRHDGLADGLIATALG